MRVLTKQDRFLNVYQVGSEVKTQVYVDQESAVMDAGIMKNKGASILVEQLKVQITVEMDVFHREIGPDEEFGTWEPDFDADDICCTLAGWEFSLDSTKELIKWLQNRVAHTESLARSDLQ